MLLFIISLTFIYMNTIKKIGYSTLAVAITGVHSAMAQGGTNGSSMFGENKLSGSKIVGSGNTLDQSAQNLVSNAMMFLALLAVGYGLYGGFLMLTAGGDDKKVSQGKTILIQVGIGLIVIFLAGSVVRWVLGLLQGV